MGGIFGGLLGLFNVVGMVILWAFIGTKSARRQNQTARWWRLILGSLSLGAGLGLIFFNLFGASGGQSYGAGRHDSSSWVESLAYIAISSVLLALIVTILELIKLSIDEAG